MMSRTPACEQDLGDRHPGRAEAADHDHAESSIRWPVSFSAFSSAASTTTAVPCWSSWKTGMSSSAFSRSSISKQRGAEMSSRLMPPKPGRDRLDGRDDLVGVLGVQADREGVDAAELLEQHRLALHHRHRRAGPMSPRPSTAVPSETTATVLRLIVYWKALSGSSWIARQTRATPGRVGHREVVAGVQRALVVHLDLAARCAAGRCGR